jgi:hypothetical protein
MTKKQYRTPNVRVGTVKKSIAAIASRWFLRNVSHRFTGCERYTTNRSGLIDFLSKAWSGAGGGNRTIKAAESTQVIHSTFRQIRQNRQKRRSEVHGGYTEPLDAGVCPMRLKREQCEKLLSEFGIWVTDACDKCGQLLGSVGWTRKDEPWEWCSKSCRDGIAAGAPKANSKGCIECGIRLDGKRSDSRFCPPHTRSAIKDASRPGQRKNLKITGTRP